MTRPSIHARRVMRSLARWGQRRLDGIYDREGSARWHHEAHNHLLFDLKILSWFRIQAWSLNSKCEVNEAIDEIDAERRVYKGLGDIAGIGRSEFVLSHFDAPVIVWVASGTVADLGAERAA